MSGWPRFLSDLIEQWPLIWIGLIHTLELTVVISISGFLWGIAIFYLKLSRLPWVRQLIDAYISFFIGMPLIVLLFLMYYGLPQWGIQMSPFTVAVIGFTMNVAAYNAA
ncbi:MAG: amino acid ABC transporter permease, partial [Gammaproteobacteria bacterium]|nr:amino acid ABC transporter permease [Gammaproteobacteria bacterium]